MNVIDISYTISNNTPVYPNDKCVSLQQIKILDKDCYNAFYLQTGLHAGTHVDIPMHLLQDDVTVDLISISKFIGNGVLLDVRGEKIISYKPKYEELICEDDIVLLFTGFCNLFDDHIKYYNDYPVIDKELSGLFIAKKIKMLGMDTPAPDKIPFTIHKQLLQHSIIILENLTNLEALLNIPRFEIFAVPLKLQAEASLVRAFVKY